MHQQPQEETIREMIILIFHPTSLFFFFLKESEGFPGGAVVGNPPANAGDTGSSHGLGGSHMQRSN